MKRIYTYYSDEEFEKISNKSISLGITPAQLVKSIVLENLTTFNFSKNIIDMKAIIDEMENNFYTIEDGKQFVVSDLVNADRWKKLTRSQKMTVSLQLKKLAESTKSCSVVTIVNNTKVYQKK